MQITRRQGREWAEQMLVQFDLNPPESLDAGIAAFWEQQVQLEREALEDDVREARVIFTSPEPGEQSGLDEVRAFAEERVRGVWSERDALDERIAGYLRNWSVYRLGTVERNALRLGTWEIVHCPEIPTPIIVNEAIDLAKFFSESKSGRFVNGVLDNLAKDFRQVHAETFTPGEGGKR